MEGVKVKGKAFVLNLVHLSLIKVRLIFGILDTRYWIIIKNVIKRTNFKKPLLRRSGCFGAIAPHQAFLPTRFRGFLKFRLFDEIKTMLEYF